MRLLRSGRHADAASGKLSISRTTARPCSHEAWRCVWQHTSPRAARKHRQHSKRGVARVPSHLESACLLQRTRPVSASCLNATSLARRFAVTSAAAAPLHPVRFCSNNVLGMFTCPRLVLPGPLPAVHAVAGEIHMDAIAHAVEHSALAPELARVLQVAVSHRITLREFDDLYRRVPPRVRQHVSGSPF